MHPFLANIFLTPTEPRLRAGWRLLGQLLLLFFFLGACGVALGLFFLVVSPSAAASQTSFGLYLVSAFVSAIAITLSVFLARRLLDRRSFASLGLGWGAGAVRALFFGIALAGLMQGFTFVISWAAGWSVVAGFAWQSAPAAEVAQNFSLMLLFFILVGWQEELFMRGYWLKNLSDGLGLPWGVALSSMIFALAHLANPGFSAGALLGLLLSGLFFAFAYLRTGQLWLPIGLHIGWNLFEGPVFGFPVSGLDLMPLIQQTVAGPELLTGGAFGPEAGLLLLPALVLGAAGIHYYATHTRSSR